MFVPTLIRQLSVLLCICMAVSCGGGGGGAAPTSVVVLATLQAVLQAVNETHPVTIADAQGAAVIEIRSDGEIRFSITVQEQWRAGVNGAHIHRGAVSVPGGIEVDFLVTSVPDDGTLTVSGTVQVDAALAEEIAAAACSSRKSRWGVTANRVMPWA